MKVVNAEFSEHKISQNFIGKDKKKTSRTLGRFLFLIIYTFIVFISMAIVAYAILYLLSFIWGGS